MLYYLFHYLKELDIPGTGVFEYISFRASMAMITSLIVGIFFGKRLINLLQRKQIGEEIRDLDLAGQMEKKGTPTMGGLIIILSILVPTLLFAKLNNIYIILMIVTTIWLGLIGFIDDYLKLKNKNKAGLRGKYKIIGQIVLGFIVGGVLYFSPDVVIRTKVVDSFRQENVAEVVSGTDCVEVIHYEDVKSTKTTIPFLKNNEFDYKILVSFLGEYADVAAWFIFIIATIFIVTAVSNGTNLTDGLDGLATGSAAIIGATLGILAYVSGNRIAADYLQILYIPNTGELAVYLSAFVGALIGFLWYNSYPAQVFMGDTGSLTLGGIIAVLAIIIKKELLLPILCGIYFAESMSVIIQVSYFKYTKRRYGEGKRVFLMAPLHHHFQKKNYPEPKIVARFWIITLLLAVISIATLKLR